MPGEEPDQLGSMNAKIARRRGPIAAVPLESISHQELERIRTTRFTGSLEIREEVLTQVGHLNWCAILHTYRGTMTEGFQLTDVSGPRVAQQNLLDIP